MRRFGLLILIRIADDLRQLVNCRPLFINRKLGVANCVNEQDVGDLKLDLLRNLVRHTDALRTRYKDTLKSLVDDRDQSYRFDALQSSGQGCGQHRYYVEVSDVTACLTYPVSSVSLRRVFGSADH